MYHIRPDFAKLPDELFRVVGEVCKQDMAIRRPVMIVLKRRTQMLMFPHADFMDLMGLRFSKYPICFNFEITLEIRWRYSNYWSWLN